MQLSARWDQPGCRSASWIRFLYGVVTRRLPKDIPKKENPESCHQLHLSQPFFDFLGEVEAVPKAALVQYIRSPVYDPLALPEILAPGLVGITQLPRPQGYVEYLGRMNPTD